jgi:hypothetical protein
MDDTQDMEEFAIDELDEVAGGCGRRGGNMYMSCQCPPQQNNNNDMFQFMILQMMMNPDMFGGGRGRRRR